MKAYNHAQIQYDMMRQTYGLFIARYPGRGSHGDVRVLTSDGEVQHDSGEQFPFEIPNLEPEAAQALAEGMWQAGLRPLAAETKEGELAALRAHRDHLISVIDTLLNKSIDS